MIGLIIRPIHQHRKRACKTSLGAIDIETITDIRTATRHGVGFVCPAVKHLLWDIIAAAVADPPAADLWMLVLSDDPRA